MVKVFDTIRSPNEIPNFEYIVPAHHEWRARGGIHLEEARKLLQDGWRIVDSDAKDAVIQRQARKIAALRSNLRGVLKSLTLERQKVAILVRDFDTMASRVWAKKAQESPHWPLVFLQEFGGGLLFAAGVLVGALVRYGN